MKKKKVKNNKIISIILPIIVLSIIAILILTKKQNSWIDNILKEDYEIYSLSCDGTTNILDEKALKEIKKNWKDLSNNGPFLGDLNTCYKKILINYNNDVVDIEIIDESSIIFKESNNIDNYTYYTNTSTLVKELNKYFN